MKVIKSKTREELLLSVINHYNSHNRAVKESGQCAYRVGSKGCAIGRQISDKLAEKLDSYCNSEVHYPEIFEMLPKRLRDMGQDFLRDIQLLHDYNNNWNSKGLSELGIRRKNKIIINYNLNISKYKNELQNN